MKTITSIYPNKFLLEKAAKCVGLFLASKGNTIKCLGTQPTVFRFQIKVDRVYWNAVRVTVADVASLPASRPPSITTTKQQRQKQNGDGNNNNNNILFQLLTLRKMSMEGTSGDDLWQMESDNFVFKRKTCTNWTLHLGQHVQGHAPRCCPLSVYIPARLSYPVFLFPFSSTFPGIDTLAALIQVSPSVAEEPAYQRGVIDCLNDPDETLKRKVTQQQQLCARRSGLRLRHIMLPWCSIVLRVSFRNWERFVRNWQWKMCMWWTWSEGRMFN